MIEATIIELISTLGFPIFVAVWFMMRTEKIIKDNTKAINRVSQAVEHCPVRK